MPVVFLSHHSENKDKAAAFIQQLEQRPLAKQHDLTVWLDKTHLQQGEQYTDQFSRYIKDENTCAFILFLPQKTMPGYVEYEIGIALNRHLEANKAGGRFPLLPLIPLYPGVACDGVMLPQSIDTFQARQFVHNDPAALDAIIGDILGLSSVAQPAEPLELASSETETADAQLYAKTAWYSFILSSDGTKLTAEDDAGNPFVLPRSELPSLRGEACLRKLSGWLLNNAAVPDVSVASRLRIMTDDVELAMLPWHLLPAPEGNGLLTDVGWIIECGPVLGRSYQREFVEFSPHVPLLVIPASDEYRYQSRLFGDSHYRVVQSDLEAYLEVRGIIQRAKRVSELRRELTSQPPDLLYICARYEGDHILLDQDGRRERSFTLVELGQWLTEAGAFPAVVLNLVGAELNHYPKILVESCRLLWVQSTSRDQAKPLETMRENFASVITGLSNKHDLADVIQQQMLKMTVISPLIDTSCYLWFNSKSPRVSIDAKGSKQLQRIRAALLKVMLGREGLKSQIAGEVMKTLGQQRALLSYAVTGHADACPHDVPEQVRQRLQWDSIQNGLPVVSYYFNVSLKFGQSVVNLLDQAIENSLLCGTNDAEAVIRTELENRGLTGQPCCISLNWFFRMDEEMAAQLEVWLVQWGRLVWENFGQVDLEQAVVINAVCLQLEDDIDSQPVQKAANKALRSLRNPDGYSRINCNIELINNKHALEELDEGEVEDFLDNQNRFWFKKLEMGQHGQPIESSAFAEWLILQTDGKFEPTVQTIWREYQQGYRGYLQA